MVCIFLLYINWYCCIGAAVTRPTHVKNETPLNELNERLVLGTSLEESNVAAGFDMNGDESTVSITVVGASGDLAKKKIFPALFALYYEGFLPKVLYQFLICFNARKCNSFIMTSSQVV